MTEQEEFEIVAKHMGLHAPELREICGYFWQACADRYEEKITEIMVQSKNQAEDWIAHLKELQAMVERLETTAKQQAEEIEALRGFSKKLQENLKNGDHLYVYDTLTEFHLIDENGKPTILLTGDRE